MRKLLLLIVIMAMFSMPIFTQGIEYIIRDTILEVGDFSVDLNQHYRDVLEQFDNQFDIEPIPGRVNYYLTDYSFSLEVLDNTSYINSISFLFFSTPVTGDLTKQVTINGEIFDRSLDSQTYLKQLMNKGYGKDEVFQDFTSFFTLGVDRLSVQYSDRNDTDGPLIVDYIVPRDENSK